MNNTWILGIDNGISGSLALMDPKGKIVMYEHVPVYKEQKWTKAKVKKLKSGNKLQHDQITLIDVDRLQALLVKYTSVIPDIHCFLERPAISYNSKWGMHTAVSASMSWAYVVFVLKKLKITRTDIDSKEWQKALIPEATGSHNKEYMKTLKAGERNDLLKEASYMFAQSICPKFKSKDPGDADPICLCEYGRRKLQGLLDA